MNTSFNNYLLPLGLIFLPNLWITYFNKLNLSEFNCSGLLDIPFQKYPVLAGYFQVLFVWVIFLSLMITLGLASLDQYAILGGLYALTIGMLSGLMGAVFSLPLGMLLSIMLSLLSGIISGLDIEDELWFQGQTFIIGLSFSISASLLMQLKQKTSGKPIEWLKEIANILAGIVVIAFLLLISIYSTRLVFNLLVPQVDDFIVWSIGIGFSAFLGIVVIRGQWKQGIVLGVFITVLLMIAVMGTQYAAIDSWYRPVVGATLLIIPILLCFGMTYLLILHLTNYSVALLSSLFALIAAYQYGLIAGGYTVISWLILGILVGSLQFIWRPIIFWLFELAWGLLLQKSTWGKKLFFTHPALWDQGQWLKLYGFDDYLLMLQRSFPERVQLLQPSILAGHQAWAIHSVQRENYYSLIKQVKTTHDIKQCHNELPSYRIESHTIEGDYWHRFSKISELLNQSEVDQFGVLTKTEKMAAQIVKDLIGKNDKYKKLREVAHHWQQLINDSLISQYNMPLLNSPYTPNGKLDEKNQYLFVGRDAIFKVLIQNFRFRQSQCLLIYGQRRIGKTWLIKKLRFSVLPNTYISVVIDAQLLASIKNIASLLWVIMRDIKREAKENKLSVPVLDLSQLQTEPVLQFMQWLDELEKKYEYTWLLLFDEYEIFQYLFDKGKLDIEEVFGLFRHFIQHRNKLQLVFIGSNPMTDYPAWLNYFVNVHSLRVSYLSTNEVERFLQTRNHIYLDGQQHLLEYSAEARQYIQHLVQGHPMWLQAICHQIIDIKNNQAALQRAQINKNDVEAAIKKVFERQESNFNNYYTFDRTPDEQAVLCHLATYPQGYIINSQTVALQRLLNIDLIRKTTAGEYQICVELFRLWLVEYAPCQENVVAQFIESS